MLVMKAPLLAAVGLFYLAYLLALVGAFSPHSGVGRTTSTTTFLLPQRHHEKDAGTTTRRRATPVADRMTKNEQDLLFGNEENGKRSLSDPPKGGGNSSGGGSSSASSPAMALVDRLAAVRTAATSCPDLWLRLAQACPAKSRAIYDSHHCDTKVDQTFAQFATTIQKSAAAFSSLGIQKGDKVALFGENSAVWLMIDQGVQLAGGATAVRGADAPTDELYYIYQHSDSKQIAVLQGPKLLKRLMLTDGQKRDELSNENGPIKTVILMNREKQTNEAIQELAAACQVTVHVFADLLEASQPITKPPSIAKTDLSTIVYTSGTTGRPKGVMLTHGNLLHQTGHRLGPTQRYEDSDPLPGEKMLSLLPVWHITERTFELWMAARGCSVIYSSIRTFKKDLAIHKPEWLVLVPRVLEKIATGVQDKFAESKAKQTIAQIFTTVSSSVAHHRKVASGLVVGTNSPNFLSKLRSKLTLAVLSPLHAVGNKLVWSKVQAGFGGSLKTVICGGSALSGGLESFYEAAGVTISVGYGLTECSPLLSFRRTDTNLVTAGCAGHPCSNTEIRVVDPEAKPVKGKERAALPIGTAGVILGRGPQIMKGYYKNPEATAKAIDEFGWFDTGDLGRINPATGDLILTGRAKDTIVLSNGENIEPVPIEDAIFGSSPLIDQIMLTGQDGRGLVAIMVLNLNELATRGYLVKSEADILQTAAEAVNDPKCSPGDCETNGARLRKASEKVRKDPKLNAEITKLLKDATNDFRKWEKVGNFYLTLEPFAMANGLLTQSYKVKRDQVLQRYVAELPK